MNNSWECHRCHAINAPHVNQCPCSVSVAPVWPQPVIIPVPYYPPTYPQPYDPYRPTCTGDDPNRPQTSWTNAYGGISISAGNLSTANTQVLQ